MGARGARKGSKFERQFCRRLGLWWCGNDGVFWRSSQSGGRATQRAKKGKETPGSYGDVTALAIEGVPLLKYMTIELKRGYNHVSGLDLIKPEGVKPEFALWIEQAERERKLAKSFFWSIVHKPDQKGPMIWFLADMYEDLCISDAHTCINSPYCRDVIGMYLEDWFLITKPAIIRKHVEEDA